MKAIAIKYSEGMYFAQVNKKGLLHVGTIKAFFKETLHQVEEKLSKEFEQKVTIRIFSQKQYEELIRESTDIVAIE